jgi:tRNA(adenine34) deaminase
MDDEHLMRLALAEAALAADHGDVPIGCVIADSDGRPIALGHNRREVDADSTAHAEIVAIRAAARARGQWRLDGCTLFVTLEPCAMCAGALVNSRIDRVVFGATDPKAGAITSLFRIGQDARLNHRFEVRGGVLESESVRLLQEFFGALRARGEK